MHVGWVCWLRSVSSDSNTHTVSNTCSADFIGDDYDHVDGDVGDNDSDNSRTIWVQQILRT